MTRSIKLKKVLCILVALQLLLACSKRDEPTLPKTRRADKAKPEVPAYFKIKVREEAEPKSEDGFVLSRQWEFDTRGAVTELALAEDGKGIWVSAIPDSDREGGIKKNALYFVDSNGQRKVSRELDISVRTLETSEDGQLGFANTYENKVVAVSSRGKTEFEIYKNCKPFTIRHESKLLCFFDDDSQVDLGLSVYGLRSKTLEWSLPVQVEAVDLRLSGDQKRGAVLLASSELVGFGIHERFLWSLHLGGEPVLDFDLNFEGSKIYVLSRFNEGRRLRVFDVVQGGEQAGTARLVREIPFEGLFDRIRVVRSREGDRLFLSQNRAAGFALEFLDPLRPDLVPTAQWRITDMRPFAFASPVVLTSNYVLTRAHSTEKSALGFSQKAWIGVWNAFGKLRLRVDLKYGEAWQLLSATEVGSKLIVVFATETGRVRWMEFTPRV